MKTILSIIILLYLGLNTWSQDTKDLQMSKDEIAGTFTDQVKEKFEIDYPIFRAYKYKDDQGDHIILFTEKLGQPNKTMPLNDAIKAFIFDYKNNTLSLHKTISDFRSDEANTASDEKSIWFWTKYLNLTDLDEDGVIDPIVVYGSAGLNKYDDGRIKILVYHKGDKIGVRHQNSTIDGQRHTKIDKTFYDLPVSLQNKVKEIMQAMTSKNHAIFPSGWESAMNNKSTDIDEN